LSCGAFKGLFERLVPTSLIAEVLEQCQVRRRRPPQVLPEELLCGLVFHGVAGKATLAQHMREATGQVITDGALAQRRANLPWEVFELIMRHALQPKADIKRHPDAFHGGLRLCGLDGSRFSVTNSPQIKAGMTKARSRRGRAAFAQVGVAVMVELGLHNPIATAVGMQEESEMVLAKQLLTSLPAKSLLIADRYYGLPEVLVGLAGEQQGHVLVRVRQNLTRRHLETYGDGSALVEIRRGKSKRLVREIVGTVVRAAAADH
jgi:hypothetical protein